MHDPHVVVESLTKKKVHEIKGRDIVEIVAILFPKNPILDNTVDVVRVDSPLSIRAEYHLKLPQLQMDKYYALLHHVDFFDDDMTGQSHAVADHRGELTPLVKGVAERLAAVIRKDGVRGGGFFPGYASREHSAIRILSVGDVPRTIANIRLVREKKMAIFSRDATIYSMPLRDMLSGNWNSAMVIKTPDGSPVLFIDRVVGNTRVLVITEFAIYMLNIGTGKQDRIKTQPEKAEEKTIAYFRGAEFATKLTTGGKILALDPFYAPTGL